MNFWRKLLINLTAIAVPAVATIAGMAVLSRIADDSVTGIIMWTWFLMGTATALNAGLHPSLTNELGRTPSGSIRWREMVAHYLSASNAIYLALLIMALSWVGLSGQSSGLSSYLLAVLQVGLVWLTGASALLMTALNFEGHADLTARSKLLFNTLVILVPVAALWAGLGVWLSLGILILIKLYQSVLLFRDTAAFVDQDFAPLMAQPFGYVAVRALVASQWQMMLIALSQMAFAFIDRWIVVTSFGIESYKEYGGILDALGMVWLLASVFIVLLHPKFASISIAYSEKKKLALHYTALLVLIGGGALFFIWIEMEVFLKVLLNINIDDDIKQISDNFIFGLFISLLYILYNTLLIASDRQGAVLIISLISLLSYCAAAFPVVHAWGLVGLSYLFLLKFLFEAACFLVYLRMDAIKSRVVG